MGGRARVGVIAAGVLVAAGAVLWLLRDDGSELGGEPITPEQCADDADLRLVYQGSSDEEGGDILGLTIDGEVRRLTDDGSSYAPSLSPDGSQIAFTRAEHVSDTVGAEGTSIQVMAVDGTGVQPLVDSEEDEDVSPAWSPDGRRVAFVRVRDRFEDPSRIFVVDADGTGARPLVDHDGPEGDTDPTWSPDGRSLAFVRWAPERGGAQLMVAAADGSGARAVTERLDEIWSPSWSPTSDRLLFTEPTDGSMEGYAVSIVDLAAGDVEQVIQPARRAVWAPTGRIYTYASAPAIPDFTGAARIAEIELAPDGTLERARAVPSIDPVGYAYGDAAIALPACDRDAPALTAADDVPASLTMTDPTTGEDVEVLTREQAIARIESTLGTSPPLGTVAKLVRSDDPTILEMGVPPPGHGGLETAPHGPFVWIVGYDDSGSGRGIAGITVYDAATGGELLSTGGPREAAVFEALDDLAP